MAFSFRSGLFVPLHVVFCEGLSRRGLGWVLGFRFPRAAYSSCALRGRVLCLHGAGLALALALPCPAGAPPPAPPAALAVSPLFPEVRRLLGLKGDRRRLLASGSNVFSRGAYLRARARYLISLKAGSYFGRPTDFNAHRQDLDRSTHFPHSLTSFPKPIYGRLRPSRLMWRGAPMRICGGLTVFPIFCSRNYGSAPVSYDDILNRTRCIVT